jgi:acetyl-CoA C-acetyltransferase
MYEAAVKAYADSQVNPRKDIQNFVTVAEDFHEGTSIFDEYVPDQLGAALKPVHTICGDGLHGLITAYMLIKTGQFDIVAVEAHSKASNLLNPSNVARYAQDPVLNRPLHLNSHFIAGLEMRRYLFETGATHQQCAHVVAKNRRNALKNPLASFGADLTTNEVLSGSPIAEPLTAHEIAQPCDGAVVMVLASAEKARQLSEDPIWILGVGWANDTPSLERRNWARAVYAQKAAQMAYHQAGISNPTNAIDFFELDDTYAYKELQAMEDLGLCRPGEAGLLVEEGATHPDGDIPVNVSGGSLGMGNFLDATGLVRALQVVLQLRGIAGGHQLNRVNVGLAQSWRGVPTTSGAVVILAN